MTSDEYTARRIDDLAIIWRAVADDFARDGNLSGDAYARGYAEALRNCADRVSDFARAIRNARPDV